MTTPYIVLGVYKPIEWNAFKIGRALTAITKRAGLIPHVDPEHGPLKKGIKVPWVSVDLHAEVRRRTFNTMQAEDWHKDGDTTSGANMDCAMVVWASNHPTELKYNGTVYQAKPYEVVIFKNTSVQHRRPLNCPKVRWMFRQRVSVPTHFSLL